MRKILSNIDFKIASIYFLFSALWIFFSDQIVHLIAPDLHTVTEFQTGKGWFFITASSILIYTLLHRLILKEREVIEQLRVNEEKFRTIYEMSYDGILLTSPSDGRILSANPSACRMLGWTEAEICSRGRSGIVDLTDPRLTQALQDRHELGFYLTGLRFIRKDNSVIECEVSSTLFTTADGEQLSSMIIREVTDRVKAEQILQESEEKFSALFMKSAFAASLASESDGRLIEINDKFEEVFGYTREEAIGKTSVELGINRDIEKRIEMFAELREKGFVGTRKIELFTKSGNQRIMSVNIHIISIRGKRYILNTTQDITDQERVLEELQRSETNLKKAQRFAHLGSWTWTIPSDSLEWSDEMFEIFGVEKSTFSGSLNDVVSATIHPDDRGAVEAANARIINRQDPIPLVYRIVTRDQIKTVWAEAGELILDKQGKPYKLSGIVQDITERISTEEKINLQANALEAAANAIVITDTKGKILWANSAFSSLTGYSESEYQEENLRIINSGRQSKEFFSQMWETILDGNIWHGEVINRHKDGHLFFEEETITPIRNATGKITHFVGIKQDISQRKEAEIRIRNLLIESQQRLERLQTLRDIDFAISSNRYLPDTLDIVLHKVKEQLEVDGVVVLLFQEALNIFTYGGSLGLTSQRIKNSRVNLGESLAGMAALEARIVKLHEKNRPVDTYFQSLLDEEQVVDYFGAPMIAKGKIIGVLEVFNKSKLTTNQEWLEYFETLAGQTAIAIENAQLLEGLQKSNLELVNSYDATIEGWSKALDLRDRETEGHTQRVTDLTLAMAKQFGFSEEQLVHLRRGALLHDIGKMGIPDAILSKPGVLTPDERKIIEKHPRYAYEMLENIDYLQPALEIPHLHHERWDGSGYPYGLKGKEIPLAARMFAVIDVYDALTSDRPYRPAWSMEKTIAYIREESGKQFDPEVVDVFLRQLEIEKLSK